MGFSNGDIYKTVDSKLANRKDPERATETTDHFLLWNTPGIYVGKKR